MNNVKKRTKERKERIEEKTRARERVGFWCEWDWERERERERGESEREREKDRQTDLNRAFFQVHLRAEWVKIPSLFVRLSACLSVCLTVCLSACMSVCLSVYLSACTSVGLYRLSVVVILDDICRQTDREISLSSIERRIDRWCPLSVHLPSINPSSSIHPSTHPPYLSIYLSSTSYHLYIYLSIYLSIYRSI